MLCEARKNKERKENPQIAELRNKIEVLKEENRILREENMWLRRMIEGNA